MGISYTDQDDHRWVGNQRVLLLEAQFDTDYTQGGEDLNASDAGLSTIEHVDFVEQLTEKGYAPRWNKTAGTIEAFEASADGNPLDEVAAGKNDLANETVQVRVWGRS